MCASGCSEEANGMLCVRSGITTATLLPNVSVEVDVDVDVLYSVKKLFTYSLSTIIKLRLIALLYFLVSE